MAFALVTFHDGTTAALNLSQYCSLDPYTIRSVRIVGDGSPGQVVA